MKMHFHEKKKDFTPLVFKNREKSSKLKYIHDMYHAIHKDWENSDQNSSGSYILVGKVDDFFDQIACIIYNSSWCY